jgi:hypothetical protein
MAQRELEPWGGEVHMPKWMRKVLRRAPDPDDTAERSHESRQTHHTDRSVLENANRAATGVMSDLRRDDQLYRQERKTQRKAKGKG